MNDALNVCLAARDVFGPLALRDAVATGEEGGGESDGGEGDEGSGGGAFGLRM